MEESTLAHLTSHELLSDVFAWYSLIGTAGSALGMLVCGWIINSLESIHGWPFIPACRVIFFVYAGVGIVKLIFTLILSSKVEIQEQEQEQQREQSPETRPLLAERTEQEVEPAPKKKSLFPSIEKDLWSLVICLFILFGVDSFASGLASLWVSHNT